MSLEKDPGCVPQFKIAIFIHFKTTIDNLSLVISSFHKISYITSHNWIL